MSEPSTALDKLASLLGFYRGTQIDNEFWVPLNSKGSILQRLESLEKDMAYLRNKVIDLDIALEKKRDR